MEMLPIIEKWITPLVWFTLAVLSALKLPKKSGRLLAIGFGTLLLNTLVWMNFEKFGFSMSENLQNLRYFSLGSFVVSGTFLFLGVAQLATPRPQSQFAAPEASGNSAKGGTTRFLAASAILLGTQFRRQCLEHLGRKHKSFAPEPGVDVVLLAKICRFFENRDRRYNIGTAATTIAFGILIFGMSAIDPGDFISAIIPISLIFVLGVVIPTIYKRHEERMILDEYFHQETFDPEKVANRFEADVEDISGAVSTREDQNLIIYGGFTPFVGAGYDIGGWSFTVDLSKPKEYLDENPELMAFRLDELYNRVDAALKASELPGLKSQDLLFISGSEIREKKWILRGMYENPASKVDAATINRYFESNDTSTRHYKRIQIQDWGSDIVVTYFLRFSRRGKNLFVEAKSFLLTPVGDKFRRIDSLAPYDWKQAILAAITTFALTPISILNSFLEVVEYMKQSVNEAFGRKHSEIRKQIRVSPLFNFGADESLRFNCSGNNYFHYFQRLDKEMYVKVMERELLDTIIRFLDEHNIETSDLKERQTTIMNHGILVQGGDVNAQAMAVGANANATISNRTKTLGKG